MRKDQSMTSPATIHGLTIEQMKTETEERISLISEEFQRGFDFMMKHPASVTVFGSARFDESNEYYQKARDLCFSISKELTYAVITGGGGGIMEAANRGAYEAGGNSLGLTIKLPHEQENNAYLTDFVDFYYFFSRKVCLAFSAEAYIFFPGGFGTMDEFFELLTLTQTEKIRKVPLILFGVDYWTPLDRYLKDELLSRGTINPENTDLYTITEDPDVILQLIKETPIRQGVRRSDL